MNVILVGALGRMGAHVEEALRKNGHAVVARVDIGYGASGGGRYTEIVEVTEKADVIIDFSFHTVTPAVARYAARNRLPAVIATTGHTDEEKRMLDEASRQTAIFSSGNMSLGIATLCDAVRRVVSAFPDADVEIVETHHNRKVDAPSGTAKMLFEAIKEVRPAAIAVEGRSGEGKRMTREVGISSLRMGNIVGVHEVMICTDNERLTLKHEAFDRALFADGAVKAAEYLCGKPSGRYTMKELLCDN